MANKVTDEMIAVDLHVHTPESKCYKINSDKDIDEEYVNLLRRYTEKNIKVIAITDHNSINGYRRLMEIKKNTAETIKHLSKYDSIDTIKRDLDVHKDILELFNKILILPGVEFEANPGVHLLLIFKPDIDIDVIEEFLSENGYPKDNQGIEDPEISTKSTIEITNLAHDLGAITIAAHVDSSKGALNTLPKGNSRAQFFKNENLMGIQVVKLDTIQHLKDLYENKEYQRNNLPAFIRCSDYHNEFENIEDYVTYMKLTNLDFDSIKDALLNNIECISFTKNPENDDIIKNIIERPQTFILKDLAPANCDELKKFICCHLNEGYGNIVIGVTESKQIIGMKKSIEELNVVLNDVLNSFDEFKGFFRYIITPYSYGNHHVIVLRVKAIKKMIFNVNGKVYLKKDNYVSEATPNDLAKKGEENFRNNFKFINERNKKVIDKINEQLTRIKRLEENINFFMKVRDISLPFNEVLNITLIDPTSDNKSYCEPISDIHLGSSTGDLYFLSSPRLSNDVHLKSSYLRVTCPTTSSDIYEMDCQKYYGECIILLFHGMSHYIEDVNGGYYIVSDLPAFRLELKEEFKNIYSLKSIVGWFKSPTLLSMLELVYGSHNLFHPKILNNIPILMTEIMRKNSVVDQYVNQIIQDEKEFLNTCEMLEEDAPDFLEKINKLIDEHNNRVAYQAIEIENQIRKNLGIEYTEEKIINDFIEHNEWDGIFIPK